MIWFCPKIQTYCQEIVTVTKNTAGMKNTVFFPLEIILGEEDTEIADAKTRSPCKENMV